MTYLTNNPLQKVMYSYTHADSEYYDTVIISHARIYFVFITQYISLSWLIIKKENLKYIV